MKRAVIYARVSKQREESVSIEAQIQQCTARAHQLGADVVKVFLDEGISGRETRNRSAFQRAKAFCEATNVDFFVTWSTSRFARNMLDLFRSGEELKEIGTKLECLNADIDDETDAGFVNKAIHGLMDEMYSRQVARDTLRSQKVAAAAGYFTGGGVPFGYCTVKDGARARLAIADEEAVVVRRIFALCLAGSGSQAIALALNEAGQLRRGSRWTKNGVNYLLKNEVYTGVRIFNKTHRRTRKTKPPEQWVKVASHPALVRDGEFERAQAMMEERIPHHEHGGGHRSMFVFTGLIHCGICSGRLQIRTGNGNGGLYSYYACLAHKSGAPRCHFRAMRADVFDDWLLDQILKHVLTPAAMREALEDLASASEEWVQERETRRAQLVAGIRDVEGRQERLFDLLERGGRDTPDLPVVTRRLREREAELQQLQAELVALEAAPMPARRRNIEPGIAAEVMGEVVLRADVKKKRAFLGALLERVTVNADGVTVDYRPEALLDAGSGTSVRSTCRWLPDLGSNQGPTD
ncbi:recombinase family protein [Ramlibacter sp.]|uniref:recombinase family protein n=1 Tax=Ramlibacter sp. TaxID=1917967 RepID=UPI003D0D2DD9